MSFSLPSYDDDFECSSSGQAHASMTNLTEHAQTVHFDFNNKSNIIDDRQTPAWNMSDYECWDRRNGHQSSVELANWKRFNDNFNISSSLKPNVWSNTNNPINERNNFYPNTERNSARTSSSEPVIGGITKQNTNKLSNEWVNSTANNFIANGNPINRRTVTSRNDIRYSNCIQPAVGMDNKFTVISSTLLPLPNRTDPISMTHLADESCDKFMQKLQVIVKNGFLKPTILTEPISPDAYELINMLIFFVMEYSKTKKYVHPKYSNVALDADIRNMSHKIELIQHEIEICQMKYMEMKRFEQETLQSFAEKSNLAKRQPKLNDERKFRYGGPHDSNNRYSNFTNNTESTQSNQCSSLAFINDSQCHQRVSHYSNQSPFDPYAQHQNAMQNLGKTFQLLPKTRNYERCYSVDDQSTSSDASQQNGRSYRNEAQY